ncbi:hypothetical protein D1871_03455 [Nakamurella silvestris]|nr:hypothetical protein D1871_03455 [Nakamurella silvestris]
MTESTSAIAAVIVLFNARASGASAEPEFDAPDPVVGAVVVGAVVVGAVEVGAAEVGVTEVDDGEVGEAEPGVPGVDSSCLPLPGAGEATPATGELQPASPSNAAPTAHLRSTTMSPYLSV